MSLPSLRKGHPASADLEARRSRMSTSWTPDMVVPGIRATATKYGDVGCLECTPAEPSGSLLYFHGGGYRMGSPAGWSNIASRVAAATGLRVIVPDYRLAPEHPFPAAIHDAIAVYQSLPDPGQTLYVGGDSAGGGLACSLPLACRAVGAPLPAGLILLSPWVDLTNANPAYATRSGDVFFPRSSALDAAELYLQGHDPKDPLASPLYGDLRGFPPTLLFASTDECLVGDALELQTKLADAQVPVETHLVPGMTHVWPVIAPALPQSQAAFGAIGNFTRYRRENS